MVIPERILFLGNSITLHGPKADIGWNLNCGMAASAADKDYVHLLLRRFAAQDGGCEPAARVANIADFERGFADYDPRQLQEMADFQASLVILAIGENVAALETAEDQAAFSRAVSALLALMTEKCGAVLVVRSCFWPDAAKDAALRQTCAQAGGIFVDISALAADERNYARSEREYSHAGVATHPGDAGMQAIAAAIWNALPLNF